MSRLITYVTAALLVSWSCLPAGPEEREAGQENSKNEKKTVESTKGKIEPEKAARENIGTGKKKAERAEAKLAADANLKPAPIRIFGFRDSDRDGRNDLFRDADGDGINDITGKEYTHKFQFIDKNGDKINDVFIDADGDGVNDLEVKFIDSDSDGINDNIIDVNGDYINDITGLRYTRKSLRGYKYGFIREERMGMMRRFVDEDGDGIADRLRGPGRMLRPGMAGRDIFIDRDGDGIDDRRQRMRRFGRGVEKGKK
ncbi:MAG: hypothetical protein U9P14_12085 [Gemmatimonadota bacterium]|nr:hypothetical protein [Gemmatimonadota bacterium]